MLRHMLDVRRVIRDNNIDSDQGEWEEPASVDRVPPEPARSPGHQV